MDSYKTVSRRFQTEHIEKKSRFIGTAFPVASLNEVTEALNEIKSSFKDASHNCFAYSLGLNGENVKQSDDGEPSGTAGKPILDVIKNNELKNTLIVVTRYFGGTLLGTGGLVHSYGKSANDVIIAAGIAVLKRFCCYEVITDYNYFGKLQYEASKMNFHITDTAFTDTVKCRVYVENVWEHRFCKCVTDLTNAKARLQKIEEVFLLDSF